MRLFALPALLLRVTPQGRIVASEQIRRMDLRTAKTSLRLGLSGRLLLPGEARSGGEGAEKARLHPVVQAALAISQAEQIYESLPPTERFVPLSARAARNRNSAERKCAGTLF